MMGMRILRRADRAARDQTDRIREQLAQQEGRAESAAGWAEKAYAGERGQLTQQLLARLVECEAGLRPLLRSKTNLDTPPVAGLGRRLRDLEKGPGRLLGEGIRAYLRL